MREIDIYEFQDNYFKSVGKDYALLTAGNEANFNTMTVAWATFGVVWGKNVITCYVRHSRYTYEFMEKNDYFTLSFYNSDFKSQLNYLGSHSGRNENKVKNVGFTPFVCENCISFNEARVTFLCKKIYHQDLDDSQISNEIKERYYPRGDFHRFYVGEIIKILSKEK